MSERIGDRRKSINELATTALGWTICGASAFDAMLRAAPPLDILTQNGLTIAGGLTFAAFQRAKNPALPLTCAAIEVASGLALRTGLIPEQWDHAVAIIGFSTIMGALVLNSNRKNLPTEEDPDKLDISIKIPEKSINDLLGLQNALVKLANGRVENGIQSEIRQQEPEIVNFANNGYIRMLREVTNFNADRSWQPDQKAQFYRWTTATTVLNLMRMARETEIDPVISKINLFSRTLIQNTARHTEETIKPRRIDPDWLRGLESTILARPPLGDEFNQKFNEELKRKLVTYVNDLPLSAVEK